MIKQVSTYVFLLVLLLFVSCGEEPKRSLAKEVMEDEWADVPAPPANTKAGTTKTNSKFDIFIKAEKSIIKHGEEVYLNVTLTNNQNVSQPYLQAGSAGSYWFLLAKVVNVTTQESALKQPTLTMLNSSKFDTLPKNNSLNPGESFTNRIALSDIVQLNNNRLSKGTYIIQVDYISSLSNTIEVTVK